MFKALISALFLTTHVHASLQHDFPTADLDANCKPVAQKFVQALLSSGTLTVDDGIVLKEKDANEMSLQRTKTVSQYAANYKAVYSAVNRQVGIQMEGEWTLTVDISTGTEGDVESCQTLSASINVDRPKK